MVAVCVDLESLHKSGFGKVVGVEFESDYDLREDAEELFTRTEMRSGITRAEVRSGIDFAASPLKSPLMLMRIRQSAWLCWARLLRILV
jgi:hypothetical protein